MSPATLDAGLVAASVAAAVAAGCTFVFSSFVMPALGQLPPPDAVRAMQAINVKAINPLFMLIFIGTGVATLALSAIHLAGDAAGAGTPWLVAGTGVYVVGVVGVTAAFNVPMNDALAAAEPTTPDAWATYDAQWTRWNHVRTLAGVVASALFAVGAIQ